MIGIDLVKIGRIETMQKRFGEKALKRFLSEEEIALVKKAQTAAGFWAAKEACAKALGCGIGAECGFHDIVITKSPKGAPLLSLSPALTARFGITDTSLSITHDGDYAIAAVALERKKAL
jgi:holo-[acyl-carrier protein] synthase